ncbi:hypothetical protein [Kitasatospora sp. NPDC087314]|uniref:hypothetical protein n=1 Tax=Kitasatospora sp. NPDC087314 TaxID=3364068 RepID=UPI0038090B63
MAPDDLQWVDAAALLLFGCLAGRARHEPLLLIGTYRDVELSDGHPLPDAEVVVLGGLDVTDVGTLLARYGPPAAAETAALVHRRTGGNPFFVQQVARLLAAWESRPPTPRAGEAGSDRQPARGLAREHTFQHGRPGGIFRRADSAGCLPADVQRWLSPGDWGSSGLGVIAVCHIRMAVDRPLGWIVLWRRGVTSVT